jgi:manganese/zinc/iron transport system substrate-binding protein
MPKEGQMPNALRAPLFAALLGAIALVGCKPAADRSTAGAQHTVVATTGMVADMARGVAADHAAISTLMGEGIDPHLYKPTRSDIEQLLGADIVFYNGLLLEGKMTDALVRAASSGRAVVAVTERIDETTLLEPDEFAGHYDPHVWMDPRTWSSAVDVVRDVLIEQDSSNTDAFTANADAYRAQIAALDAYSEDVLGTVPADRRVLVTAHDAFNYFGRRYGFEVVGIQGLSTESEAGVRDIERLVDLLVSRHIPAVFVESTVSERNIRALIDGARARGHTVVIGGSLFSDAMGASGTYEGTYIGMIDHNVTTIARALGGDAPARGMNGRLAE